MAAYTEYTGPPMSTQGVPVGPQWQERMATQHFDASPAPPAAAAVVPDGSNNFYADVLAAAKADLNQANGKGGTPICLAILLMHGSAHDLA